VRRVCLQQKQQPTRAPQRYSCADSTKCGLDRNRCARTHRVSDVAHVGPRASTAGTPRNVVQRLDAHGASLWWAAASTNTSGNGMRGGGQPTTRTITTATTTAVHSAYGQVSRPILAGETKLDHVAQRTLIRGTGWSSGQRHAERRHLVATVAAVAAVAVACGAATATGPAEVAPPLRLVLVLLRRALGGASTTCGADAWVLPNAEAERLRLERLNAAAVDVCAAAVVAAPAATGIASRAAGTFVVADFPSRPTVVH
jgi:hypothetical protein